MKKEFLKIEGASILQKQQLQSISGGWEGGVDPSVCADASDGTQCGPHHSCYCYQCYSHYDEIPDPEGPHCH
ncbi:hypothetical protein [Pseudotenacibaculum haliotis]|uniref:Bacteriocin n=1 Tax=Pseudotenacibaculum haliotis TaxID=1862138 RepID=A0ABW5LSR8_9FLAO